VVAVSFQPAVFISSAFALGLVGARFFKSSRQQDRYGYGNESRRTRYGGTAGPSTVHDYSAGNRNYSARGDEAVVSNIASSDVERDPATPLTSGGEGGASSSRGRRTTSRTGQS